MMTSYWNRRGDSSFFADTTTYSYIFARAKGYSSNVGSGLNDIMDRYKNRIGQDDDPGTFF